MVPPARFQAVPILRIYDVTKALAFYVDFLGFREDWRHEFEPGAPLYLQVSREGLVLHLSEHFGDGTPGSHVFVRTETGIRALHTELIAKNYRHLRPGLEQADWGDLTVTVIDPFQNVLVFSGRE